MGGGVSGQRGANVRHSAEGESKAEPEPAITLNRRVEEPNVQVRPRKPGNAIPGRVRMPVSRQVDGVHSPYIVSATGKKVPAAGSRGNVFFMRNGVNVGATSAVGVQKVRLKLSGAGNVKIFAFYLLFT